MMCSTRSQVACGDGKAYHVCLRTCTVVGELAGHTSWVFGVAATGGVDGKVG